MNLESSELWVLNVKSLHEYEVDEIFGLHIKMSYMCTNTETKEMTIWKNIRFWGTNEWEDEVEYGTSLQC